MDVSLHSSLPEWNHAIRINLLPDTIILGIYLFVGVLGNVAVILVYLIRMRGQMDDRYFIPWLALFDLLATVFIAINKIVANMYPVTHDNEILCRLSNFMSRTSAASADGLLVAISIQRFQRICRPFGIQMKDIHKRYILVFVMICAVVLNLPVFIFYGIHRFENGNITGCSCDHVHGGAAFERLMLSYDILVFLLLFICMVSMSVLYFLISRKIKSNRIVKRLNTKRRNMSGLADDSTENGCSENITSEMTAENGMERMQTDVKKSIRDLTNQERKSSTRIKRKQSTTEQIRTHLSANRYTYMFMALSMSFIISYFPSNILKMVEISMPNMWMQMDPAVCNLFLFFRQFYILNHVTNPYIYSAFDTSFRQELKKMLRII
ncbi:hypothetical protein FSP39_005790 [Pinctada imbricata]|uniref:G-protein coupled receptors family 1 profile domain-containing protein n=1 Tax=Pinctada imbricata TaxID=66713 RepID=A0AA88YCA0_PINIB|nr:hypothetical protein FSP39_005790 [Pinctada imbricata]